MASSSFSTRAVSFENWRESLLVCDDDKPVLPFVIDEKSYSPTFNGRRSMNRLSLFVSSSIAKDVTVEVDPFVLVNDAFCFLFDMFCNHPQLSQLKFRLEIFTESRRYESLIPVAIFGDKVVFNVKQHFPSVLKHSVGVPFFLWVQIPGEPEEWLVQSSTAVIAGQELEPDQVDRWLNRVKGLNQGESEVS